LAGGIDMLSNPSGDSIVTPWEKIVRYNPEVLVIAPCGFHIKQSLEEIHLLTERQEWLSLKAVQNDRVYLIDFDLFTQPSASTLVDGIEVLAHAIHPEFISLPAHLEQKVYRFEKLASEHR
jgi:iron complex transport system substrate-binding protein